jgi:hypothetical protein
MQKMKNQKTRTFYINITTELKYLNASSQCKGKGSPKHENLL